VTDACTRLVCTVGCLVANVCWGDGVVNPANPCLVCDGARSTTAWSNRDGVACDDGLFCTVNDVCSGGACAGTARTCSDGRFCNGVETCDEAADVCTPHPNASCDASAPCADGCTQYGQLLPYFVATVQPAAAPTPGGVTLTLVGSFGEQAGASLVDQATGASLLGNVAFWSQDRIQLVAPAGSRDREITFMAAGGTGAPFLSEVVQGWRRAFVQRATFPIRYLPPTVTRVSGCVDDTATAARGCSVNGGERLVVAGTNLGNDASAVQVSVDGKACTGVTLDTPHTTLRCTLAASPSGGFDLPVTVTVGGRSGTLARGLSYFGPEIVSVRPNLDLDPLGGSVVEVVGRFFGADPGAIEVQLGDDPELVASARSLVSDAVTGISTLTFSAPPGVGADWPVSVQAGLVRSPPSADTVSYVRPVLIPSTVRGTLGGTPSSSYTFVALPGSVFFDVLYAGTRAGALQVWIKQPGTAGDEQQACLDPVLVPSAGERSTLSCRVVTNLSPRGLPMRTGSVFRIETHHALSAEGTDMISPPQCATLAAVSGCVDAGFTTRECPTEGGIAMSALGIDFHTDLDLLTVGGDLVDASYAGTTARFVLPPGVGSAAVVLRNGGCCSAPITIEYGAPTVSGVSGCVDWQGATGDCPVAGGTTLTITGSNFGAAGAAVLVGAVPCGSVVQDAADPHHRLTCVLPPGAGQDLPVLVVNRNVSTNAGSLSYQLP
jgi:hypothetical protein